MKKIFLLFLLFISVDLLSQTDSIKHAPYTIVETMPEYPGGTNEMMLFIQKNTEYPKSEKDKGIQGTVYVTFVVEKDGSIGDAKVLRGIPCGPLTNQAAVDVVNKMPRWKPGTQNGKTVRVQYNLPVKFKSTKVPFDCKE
jgi:periplasmic protein TonB